MVQIKLSVVFILAGAIAHVQVVAMPFPSGVTLPYSSLPFPTYHPTQPIPVPKEEFHPTKQSDEFVPYNIHDEHSGILTSAAIGPVLPGTEQEKKENTIPVPTGKEPPRHSVPYNAPGEHSGIPTHAAIGPGHEQKKKEEKGTETAIAPPPHSPSESNQRTETHPQPGPSNPVPDRRQPKRKSKDGVDYRSYLPDPEDSPSPEGKKGRKAKRAKISHGGNPPPAKRGTGTGRSAGRP